MNDRERKELRYTVGYLAPGYRERVAAIIGAQIKKRREEAGMTPEQIEQKTGYKASKIKANESGAFAPKTVTELFAIAEAMGCHLEIVKD